MVRRQDASTGQIIEDGKEAPVSADGALMEVKVYSPYKTYYDEKAFSLTAQNETGVFDILPHHHNFITLISEGKLIIRAPRGEQKITINGGLMHVKADRVIVFLNV